MDEKKPYARFYNTADFEISMRRVWEKGAPPVKILPGGMIEGPYEYLIDTPFLKPIGFDFHLIPSMTQTSDGFEDKKYTEPAYPGEFKIVSIANVKVDEKKETEEIKKPEVVYETSEAAQEIPQQKVNVPTNGLPFDPENVNWIAVTLEELKQACQVLGVDTTQFNSLKNKDLKWKLVKVVKEALGKNK
jgi:hypothetical protein